MTNNLFKQGAAMAAMLLAAATLQAGTFQGSTSGAFWNPVGPGVPDHVTGVGTDTFTWGTPDSSSLQFGRTTFDTDCGVEFLVGTLTYENATSDIGTGATGVDLAVTFQFILPSVPDEVFTYTINLVNTINTGDIEDSADQITIPDEFRSQTMIIDGQPYTLSVWFGAVTGLDGHVDPADPHTFHVHEGGTATVNLDGIIQCPDGGLTIALLGAALGGIGLLNRKMRK